MLLGVLAVYIPIRTNPADNTLVGLDYFELHLFRIRFAQQALFSAKSHLPAWYPRELLGTPFWSNIQDFPFLPTRLLMLAWDPLLIYPIAINVAALLAATFTFLYARRIGLSAIAAAFAGWTFAAAGFYASRVLAGHLPLLEAYPALPLLLWLVERCRFAQAEGPGKASTRLLGIGTASACVAMAGHPQIPIYSIAAAILYAQYRCRGRAGTRVVASIISGAGCAAFALWPMWLLIRRSTRVLALDPPTNDIAFPLRRFVAFVLPWSQGWPGAIPRVPHVPVAFSGDAYFWETVCYIGLLPLAALVLLAVRSARLRRLPAGPWRFILVLSVAGLFLSLSVARLPFSHVGGTFLRSPARLLYFTAFGLALALAVMIDLLARLALQGRWWAFGLISLAAVAHGLDLGSHDRWFIRTAKYDATLKDSDLELAQRVAASRVAIDSGLWTPLNRELDDVGYFDSIALARPYVTILDLAGQPPTLNTQYIDGSDLNRRALACCGVAFVATTKSPGMEARPGAPIHVYSIPDFAPRAEFFPEARVLRLSREEIHGRLRDRRFDLARRLMLPADGKPAGSTPPEYASADAQVIYTRNSEDRMTITLNPPTRGALRILESWDPGWAATVDGRPATIVPADDTFLAVEIPPGPHTVVFTFSTPGVAVGGILSGFSALCLGAAAFGPRLRKIHVPAREKAPA